MLDSQGEETRDAQETRELQGAREKGVPHSTLTVQPLCDCASTSSSFVVFTCPKCMGVALRALEEVVRGEKGFF